MFKIKQIIKKNKYVYKFLRSIYHFFSLKNFKIILSYINILFFHDKDKNLCSSMEDGLLRIRITNLCNAKCRYCGIQLWDSDVQKQSLDTKFLYEYCKPLYEKIKILLLTGGDPLFAKGSYEYASFISKNYPKVTMILETNGILFDEKWQDLAISNLISTHFSINASNEYIFQKGCWQGEKGKKAFLTVQENLKLYINKLQKKNLLCFAPDISMVINKDTYQDIYNFVKMGLLAKVKLITFYFDYTENDMDGNYFKNIESRIALKELMKIERVLAKKFCIGFRLWVPLKELENMQLEVEKIPIEELRKEYAELLELAKDRDMKKEYEDRQTIRKKYGKKEFTFEEDWAPTLHQIKINSKNICFAPFKELDIYPDAKAEVCGWVIPRINLKKEIKNNYINWDKLFNSIKMKQIRYDMLNNNFRLCQKCCPLNSDYNPICEPHKYGYDREIE